ncbi:MAG TPA: FAD-binding protein, partial [Gemmatimonadaceae bacterium]|nr:FAD-binding protein [Gemmatimonadaceae bacterium]
MSIALIDDKSVRKAYEADASGLHLIPELVARPESTDEVVELMRRATADRTAVTCAGAQTSTTGASITDSGILLSLRSLAGVSDVDVKARTMTVGPGALVGDIKRA